MSHGRSRPLKRLSCALILSSCASPRDDSAIVPVYDKESGRLQRLDYDSDKDGTPDTVSFMDGQKVIRIEIDKDQDGRVERWEYYSQDQKLVRVGISRLNDGIVDAWSYNGPDGSLAQVDLSGNRDGRITRKEFYEAGQLVRVEETAPVRSQSVSSDPSAGLSDWKPARWEFYDRSGRLTTVAFDSSGRGVPERRLVYDTNGGAHLEVDADGDGRFEPPSR